ncbi:MAG: methyl-accepting chemotaxis protein [SAR324 cluster bacterium]|nr:methyl-accepting chemotaxis protein [SAR324 cluster bacterium]
MTVPANGLAWKSKLAGMTAELKNLSQNTENEFLSMGKQLQAFTEIFNQSTFSASTIVQMMNADDRLTNKEFNHQFEQTYQAVDQTIQTIAEKIPDFSHQTQSLTQELNQSKNNTQRLLGQLDGADHYITEQCEKLKKLSFLVTPEIGKIVSTLQYHDIARQQMEHISAALVMIDADLSKMFSGQEEEERQILHRIARMIELQIAQIRNVLDETTDATKKISLYFQQIFELIKKQTVDANVILKKAQAGCNVFSRVVPELETLLDIVSSSKAIAMKWNHATADEAHFSELNRYLQAVEAVCQQSLASLQKYLADDEAIIHSMNQLSQATRQLEQDITQLINNLQFDRIIHSELRTTNAELVSMLKEIEPILPDITADDVSLLKADLEEWVQHYTMNHEREVHAGVFAKFFQDDKGPENSPSGGNKDLGDNVELW